MTDSLIHLRIPAATKGRWVRASRAAGQRLSDYITNAVEAYMQQQLTRLAIPDDLTFSDLRLARDADGAVSFDWAVIERICRANNLPVELLREGPEDNVAGLLIGWYSAHRNAGGAPDPVAEDLLAEVQAEDAAGQAFSYEPGRA
ncbi:hypothetical protein DBO86_22740 [Pseudomonas indoloxydans]|uniref:Uncharacterized protein n=1 Tax=Ectopseudomonas oleovorans TaxID=301 RepID=A0A2T5PGF7_ECTOL|nr:hypothetical protein [Pseudomonas indoloxydans]PTU76824.1 hypothetical protein DBO86_22740 [Pseudomonas indoloxydans]